MLFEAPLKEQALVYKPKKLMLVGCSHPGIAHMAKTAFEKYGKLSLIIGGFHLFTSSENEIYEVANNLNKLTEFIAPSHCTGEKAISIFKEIFGERFVENYAGRVIDLESFK